MARKSAATSDDENVAMGYSIACRSCGAQMAFDEIPDNRLLECPECSEVVMVPDTLGNEQQIIDEAEARAEEG